jgi:hypothetical protein
MAKFTPVPSQVAPSGNGEPGRSFKAMYRVVSPKR